MFCTKCGKEIDAEAVICPNCGCATDNNNETPVNTPSAETMTSEDTQPPLTQCKTEENINPIIPNGGDSSKTTDSKKKKEFTKKDTIGLAFSLFCIVLIIVGCLLFAAVNMPSADEKTTKASVTNTTESEKEPTETEGNSTETTKKVVEPGYISLSDFKSRTQSLPLGYKFDNYNETDEPGTYNGDIAVTLDDGSDYEYGNFLICTENDRVIFTYGRLDFSSTVAYIDPSNVYNLFVGSALSCCSPIIFGDTYVSNNEILELFDTLEAKESDVNNGKFTLSGEKNNVVYEITYSLQYSEVTFNCYPKEFKTRFKG